jgi:hypothetical protein
MTAHVMTVIAANARSGLAIGGLPSLRVNETACQIPEITSVDVDRDTQTHGGIEKP